MGRELLGTKAITPCPGASQHSPDPGTATVNSVGLQDFFITQLPTFAEDHKGTVPPELKPSGAGEHLCGNPCSSAAGLSCPPFCSLQQRTLQILAQNPNLLHAPSHLAPLPSPGMAKLLKNQSKHFSVEDFPAQAVEELPKEIQL